MKACVCFSLYGSFNCGFDGKLYRVAIKFSPVHSKGFFKITENKYPKLIAIESL
jgi:hypothetical protein